MSLIMRKAVFELSTPSERVWRTEINTYMYKQRRVTKWLFFILNMTEVERTNSAARNGLFHTPNVQITSGLPL